MLRQLPNARVICAVVVGVLALWILDARSPQTLIITVLAGGVVLLALYDPVDAVARPRLLDVLLSVGVLLTPILAWRVGGLEPLASAAAGLVAIAVALARFEWRRRDAMDAVRRTGKLQ